MGIDYVVVPATCEHLGFLSDVERRAAVRFGSSVPTAVLNRTTPPPVLAAARKDGRLWVALAPGDEVVGFALVRPGPRDRAHLEEIDVVPEHGRRGIGTALLSAVEHWAAANGCTELTLTTYRDVPWSVDFYLKAGFEPVQDNELDYDLQKRLDEEAALGLERSRRVAMRKWLVPPNPRSEQTR